MKSLEKCRQEIDQIDRKMVELFEQRMNLVKEVTQYKMENHLEIYQSQREEEVILKNSSYLLNHEWNSYYLLFIQSIMEISKEYQREVIGK